MSKSKWNAKPATDEWNSAKNWEPAIEPTKEAIFSTSDETEITFSPTSDAKINTIEFTEDAATFTFKIDNNATIPALTISGGVVNNSKNNQYFIIASKGVSYKEPQLKFENSASAGGVDMNYYAGPNSLTEGYGGGIIGFFDKSTAGEASFVVKTGEVPPPKENSTVGGEVSFCDEAKAGTAHFKVYGTLGTDGDTFGNVVFHDKSNAERATFVNVGGTVYQGDGGNTQFYDTANAANGVYLNYGGTFSEANGGDTVFDGNSNGGNGQFHNFPAQVSDAHGGVMSFNNNPPKVTKGGSSAGNGIYHNYGASEKFHGGGGHIEFSAIHGCPTAARGIIHNYGSVLEESTSAGHTIFSISPPTTNFPTAGNAEIWNHPSIDENCAAGYTEFTVYNDGEFEKVPTAANATIYNLGGKEANLNGGFTKFSGFSTAANAKLVALGGKSGGKIIFEDDSEGGNADIHLFENGILKINDHNSGITIQKLEIINGIIILQTGKYLTNLTLKEELILNSEKMYFSFPEEGGEFEYDKPYIIFSAPNLSDFETSNFEWKNLEDVYINFSIIEEKLQVNFHRK
ncbi:hypothetical protein [Aureivirga marina]|uniref:hypothetical protein n=1 Tax=Aureivirga marina TaxID=1182451 RepID=UPI0018CAAB7F|nr:hypothetical protein [Aureivirga marina]